MEGKVVSWGLHYTLVAEMFVINGILLILDHEKRLWIIQEGKKQVIMVRGLETNSR